MYIFIALPAYTDAAVVTAFSRCSLICEYINCGSRLKWARIVRGWGLGWCGGEFVAYDIIDKCYRHAQITH